MDKNDTSTPSTEDIKKEGLSLEVETGKVTDDSTKNDDTLVSDKEEFFVGDDSSEESLDADSSLDLGDTDSLGSDSAENGNVSQGVDDDVNDDVFPEDDLVATPDHMAGVDDYDSGSGSKSKMIKFGVAAVVVLSMTAGGYYAFTKFGADKSDVADSGNKYSFVDTIDDDIPSFASNDETSGDVNTFDAGAIEMGFSAPPQPDENDFTTVASDDSIPLFPESDKTYVKDADDDVSALAILEESNIDSDVQNEVVLGDGVVDGQDNQDSIRLDLMSDDENNDPIKDNLSVDLSLTEASEDSSVDGVDSLNKLAGLAEPVDVSPPSDDSMDASVSDYDGSVDGSDLALDSGEEMEFDDTPEISDVEQVPGAIAMVPPQMPLPSDMYANIEPKDSITPDVAPNITTAIPNSTDSNVSYPITSNLPQGVLNSDVTENIKETMRKMPAKEAIIRPLPKKYLIIHTSGNMKKSKQSSLSRASHAIRSGKHGDAVNILDKMLIDNPTDSSVIMKKALMYQQSGHTKEALKMYERVLRHNPSNLDALTNMLGLIRKKSPNTALAKLSELRSIYPNHPGIAAQLAIAYGEVGNYKNALRNLDIATRLDEPNAYYAFNKAVILDHMGQSSEAIEMYKKSLYMHRKGQTGTQSIPVDAVLKRLRMVY